VSSVAVKAEELGMSTPLVRAGAAWMLAGIGRKQTTG